MLQIILIIFLIFISLTPFFNIYFYFKTKKLLKNNFNFQKPINNILSFYDVLSFDLYNGKPVFYCLNPVLGNTFILNITLDIYTKIQIDLQNNLISFPVFSSLTIKDDFVVDYQPIQKITVYGDKNEA